jgi:hypothetical protein
MASSPTPEASCKVTPIQAIKGTNNPSEQHRRLWHRRAVPLLGWTMHLRTVRGTSRGTGTRLLDAVIAERNN